VTGVGLCRQNGATVTINDKIASFLLASGNVILSPTFEGDGTGSCRFGRPPCPCW